MKTIFSIFGPFIYFLCKPSTKCEINKNRHSHIGSPTSKEHHFRHAILSLIDNYIPRFDGCQYISIGGGTVDN